MVKLSHCYDVLEVFHTVLFFSNTAILKKKKKQTETVKPYISLSGLFSWFRHFSIFFCVKWACSLGIGSVDLTMCFIPEIKNIIFIIYINGRFFKKLS